MWGIRDLWLMKLPDTNAACAYGLLLGFTALGPLIAHAQSPAAAGVPAATPPATGAAPVGTPVPATHSPAPALAAPPATAAPITPPSAAVVPPAPTPNPSPDAAPAPGTGAVQPLSEGAIAPIAAIPSAAPTATVGDDYLVNPGDVLDVQVVGLDQTPRKARVDASGVITLPLIGSVQVAGRPPREIEVIIADMLKVKYMQDPQVTVFVDESVSQRFSIEGAVRTPNLFPLKGRMTLLQALAMSGGATKVANLSEVRVLRGNGANKQNLIFDAEKIRDGESPDPQIYGNDVIIVQASAGKTAFYETLDTIRGIMSFGTVR
jgi:polysaccharide export outer membrane protein